MLEPMPELTTTTKWRWVINTTAVKREHGALLKVLGAFRCPLENTGLRGNHECSKPPRICTSMPGLLLLLHFSNKSPIQLFPENLHKLSIHFAFGNSKR